MLIESFDFRKMCRALEASRRLTPVMSALLAAALAASACGSDRISENAMPDAGSGSDAGSGEGDDGSGDTIQIPEYNPALPEPVAPEFIYPERAFTGFDGVNTFRVPIVTSLAGATWEVADPTVLRVDAEPAPAGYEDIVAGMIVALKPGVTEVRAKSGAKTLSLQVTVVSYTAAKVAAGRMRYETPANATKPERQACAFCHQSENGVDHSSSALAYFEDAEILSAVTTGVYPDGYVLEGIPHKWDLTAEEREGIVPYLRALPPKPF